MAEPLLPSIYEGPYDVEAPARQQAPEWPEPDRAPTRKWPTPPASLLSRAWFVGPSLLCLLLISLSIWPQSVALAWAVWVTWGACVAGCIVCAVLTCLHRER
jgi:hypothetical protein